MAARPVRQYFWLASACAAILRLTRAAGEPWRESVWLACLCTAGPLLLLNPCVTAHEAAQRKTHNVLLVTLDGLRWQELFSGADRLLLNRDDGGVRDVAQLSNRFWRDDAEARRKLLMPFFWEVVACHGQVFGDPQHHSLATVTNGHYFSYPGYSEILTGRADPRVDSNDKRLNPNVTVLEWLHQQPAYRGRVAAYCSWDVFPFIINAQRSGIPVNAGWQPVAEPGGAESLGVLDQLAPEIPHVWSGVRYDIFTVHGAVDYLRREKPRVLYVAMAETDDWAHEGRYDLYLEAAWRIDRYIRRLWEAVQAMDEYAGKTSLVITTDHGRGDTRTGWKSHGRDFPGSDRIWIAVMGPDTPSLGLRRDVSVTQSQVAATVAQLLGEDFLTAQPPPAAPLPGVISPVAAP